jgi:hypothetical protein
MRKALGLTALVLASFLGGCVDLEYGIVLDEDLSGTSTLDMNIDLDRIAYMGAVMQRAFSGKEGPPTDEEVDAIRQKLLEEMDDEQEFNEAEMREEIEDDLPAGVRLLGATFSRDGLETSVGLQFAFDNVASLNELHIEAGDDEDGDPMGQVGGSRPFKGLQIIDEGNALVVRNEPINPLDLQDESAMFMPEGLLASVFEDLRIAFKIETPFEAVEHNATRVEGHTLYWEYDLENLSDDPRAIYVRYRK